MLAWTLSSLAWAAPVVEVTDDGAVRGSVEVGADALTLGAVLRDPEAWYAIVRPGDTVIVQPDPDPACRRVEVSTPHPILPTTYVARDCWTEDGVTSELIDSAQLAELESTWAVEPHGDHAMVTFRLYVRLEGAIPRVLVRASTKRGVVAALGGVEEAFASNSR
jgi:hypothetical protein